MATIERAAVAQTQLIDDLLDMSRIISGKPDLALLRSLALTCDLQAEKRLPVEVMILRSPHTLEADRVRSE